MRVAGSIAPTRLTRKLCTACGYSGRQLQSDPLTIGYTCPRCGVDLYARPPRSYAQMEGLVVTRQEPTSLDRLSRLLHSATPPRSRRCRVSVRVLLVALSTAALASIIFATLVALVLSPLTGA